MDDAVRLQLYIGSPNPTPAPRVAIEALREVIVTVRDRGRSGFQITFAMNPRSPLDTWLLLTGGQPVNVLRVVIATIFKGIVEVLMDGVVTDHEILPGSHDGFARLSVTGQDLSVLMDKIDFSGVAFPATSAEDRVQQLLMKYASLGIVPRVVPGRLVDVPAPPSRVPSQRRTDLAYIQSLARRVGHVFYLEPGPTPGVNTAYWGPPVRNGLAQRALNVDMDAHTNVQALNFTFDNNVNGVPAVRHIDEDTGQDSAVSVPDATTRYPPLGLRAPLANRRQPIDDNIAKRSLPEAMMLGMARITSMAEAVSARGELDITRYGAILKARRLVGVRGAGIAFDGLYYVRSVTHRIQRGQYRQSFELSRDGLKSTVATVPV